MVYLDTIFKDKWYEWIFSGIGVATISLLISGITAFVTYLINKRRYFKNVKKISYKLNINKLSLQKEENIYSEKLYVSYDGEEYKNLCFIEFDMENIGDVSIENLLILLVFDENTIFIKESSKKKNSNIEIEENEAKFEKTIEIKKKIIRFESKDYVKFYFLVDTEFYNYIKVNFRGLDNNVIFYDKSTNESSNKHSKLIFLIIFFVFVSNLSIIGEYLKFLILVFIIPDLKEYIDIYLKNRMIKPNYQNIVIKDSESNKININY